MKKHFWKIEYSITILVIFGVLLLLMPSKFIKSRNAAYISRWNETFNKMDYVFTAMNAQADSNILKSLKKTTDNEQREQLMINLVKPYIRISDNDELNKRYTAEYMNGKNIEKGDKYHFENLYVSENNIIVGIKDILNTNDYQPAFMMMFDMNGLKGPNVWGKDIYGINIFVDGKITPLGYDWDLDEIKQDCSDKGSGVSCSQYYRIGGDFND